MSRPMLYSLAVPFALVALTALGAFAYRGAITRTFLYHPTHDDAGALATGGWQAVTLQNDGEILQGLVHPSTDPDGPWLVYFGGNAMPLGSLQGLSERVATGAGWGAALFAYRGYDGSTGVPGQDGILSDAAAVPEFLERRFGVAPSRLVILGQSLGSGVAAHVAAALGRAGTPPRGTALISPYVSMDRVFNDHVPVIPIRWLVSDPYPTDVIAGDIPGPVLIVHGDRDPVIDVDHGRRLTKLLGGRATYHELPGVGHNDIWGDPRLDGWIRHLAQTGDPKAPPAVIPR